MTLIVRYASGQCDRKKRLNVQACFFPRSNLRLVENEIYYSMLREENFKSHLRQRRGSDDREMARDKQRDRQAGAEDGGDKSPRASGVNARGKERRGRANARTHIHGRARSADIFSRCGISRPTYSPGGRMPRMREFIPTREPRQRNYFYISNPTNANSVPIAGTRSDEHSAEADTERTDS